MSTSASGEGEVKKISSWVRPGVCEVRARARRPVSALIRLDLPTLERPAKAISTPRIGGKASGPPAAAANCQSPANSLRPASISSGEEREAEVAGTAPEALRATSRSRLCHFFFEQALAALPRVLEEAFQSLPRTLEIVPELDLGAVPVHDHALLRHRERVVPGPVDHEPGREACQHEGEDDRHVVEDHRLRRSGRRRMELRLHTHGHAHYKRPNAEHQEGQE